MLLEELFARIESTGDSIQTPADDARGGLAVRIPELKVTEPKRDEVPPSATFKRNL